MLWFSGRMTIMHTYYFMVYMYVHVHVVLQHTRHMYTQTLLGCAKERQAINIQNKDDVDQQIPGPAQIIPLFNACTK